MEWWQTLIVAAVPAAVTLAGVLFQQARADRRELAYRKADRDERTREQELAAKEAARSRQYALDDSWRVERRNAHAELIGGFDRCFSDMLDFVYSAREAPPDEKCGPWETPVLSLELSKDLNRSKVLVDLLASDAAQTAADNVYQAIQDIDSAAGLGLRTNRHVGERYDDFHRFMDQYRDAARRDIGTGGRAD